jgi:hypothetical protein
MLERSQTDHGAAGDYQLWVIYIDAREEARRHGGRRVGTEHLVLALLGESALANALGSDLDEARTALEVIDDDALAAAGLDARFDVAPLLERELARAPRRPTLKAVLQGRLPLTPAAKSALRGSSGEMRRDGRHPGPRCVLGELLRLQWPGPAAELFSRLGVDADVAAERLTDA